MSAAAHPTLNERVSRLAVDGREGPRAATIVFLVVMGIDAAFALPSGVAHMRGVYLLGLALGVAACALSWVNSHEALPTRISLISSGTDVVAVYVCHLYAPSALGFAVALPAVWLGVREGFTGLRVVVATATAGTLVTVLALGPSPSIVVDGLVLWLVALFVALPGAVSSTHFNRLTRRLRDARRFEEALVHSLDVAIQRVDRDGTTVSANPRHRELAARMEAGGLDEESGSAIFAEDGTTPLTADELPVPRVLSSGDFRNLVMWVGSDPATARALSVSGQRIYDDHGNLDGAALAFHDVTQLVHALKVKDDFVASISHELRTPLSSILLNLEVARRADVPAELQQDLDTIARNAARLQGLVEDLLTQASTSPHATISPVPMDLAEVLPHVVETLGRQAGEKGVRLVVRTAPAPVLGDAGRLEQVLSNLVSNAVKYSHPGGEVLIEVMAEGERAVLRVTDHGMGMSEEEQEGLFQRFFRADRVRQAAIAGVGLGLVITRDIVWAHGGQIYVHSRVDEGSVLEVVLPVRLSRD